MKQGKRDDLQLLRALAILAVISYHFLPNVFVNGYLGVDVFFVLSGFLISVQLLKSETIQLIDVKSFYEKRFKRIMPLYYFLMALTILCIILFIPIDYWDRNVNLATIALKLMSNLPNSRSGEYFSAISNYNNFFVHTWTLAVEVQFYLVAPLVLYLCSRTSRCSIPYLIILSVLSLYYQICLASSRNKFHSLPARLWQFLLGAIISAAIRQDSKLPMNDKIELKEQEESFTTRDIIGVMSISVLILLLSFPLPMDDLFCQMLSTILTAMIVYCNMNMCSLFGENNQSILNCFIYLGDISYVLYLVHWGIFVAAYILCDGIEGRILGLLASIALSILIHEFFEKWYLSKDSIYSFMFTVLLIATSTMLIIYIQLTYHDKVTALKEELSQKYSMSNFENVTFGEHWSRENALEVNRLFQLSEADNLQLDGFMLDGQKHYCPKNTLLPATNLTIMVIGNSYASNHAQLLCSTLGPIAKELIFLTKPVCNSLVRTVHVQDVEIYSCDNWPEKLLDEVRAVNPDILFILDRQLDIIDDRIHSEYIQNDALVISGTRNIRIFEESVKQRVYILDVIPRTKFHVLRETAKFDFRQNTQEELFEVYDPSRGRLRLNEITKNCKKCELIDYTPLFTFDEKFEAADHRNGLSFFTDTVHLTPHALNRIKHVYERIRDELLVDYIQFLE